MTRSLRYSDAAIAVLADFNDVHPDQMRHHCPEAGNADTHAWMEALGARFVAGLEVYRVRGQFYTPDELATLERSEAA
jgi:hypothetical protein